MMTLYSIADKENILHGFGLWKTIKDATDVLNVLKRYADPLGEFCVKAIDSLTGLELKDDCQTNLYVDEQGAN